MDAITYWLSTSEPEIHFIDAVLSFYDGLANVRREFGMRDGQTFYRIFVAPGMETEFLKVVERLRQKATLGALLRGEDLAKAVPQAEPKAESKAGSNAEAETRTETETDVSTS